MNFNQTFIKKELRKMHIPKKYIYTHNVCYWTGNNRISNLYNHIKILNETKLSSSLDFDGPILCILSIMVDDINKTPIDEIEFLEFLSNDKVEVKVLYWYNSGGTVKSMWNVYKEYFEKSSIQTIYLGTWEDDYMIKNDYWLDDIIPLLQFDYIFIGSLWEEDGFVKFFDGYKEIHPDFYNKPRKVAWLPNIDQSVYRWCEDPYILQYDSLKKIEDAIGVFTTAPSDERYDYISHGINQGEIGFPTRLTLAGFKFKGLNKDKWIQDLNMKSNIDYSFYYK